MATNPSETQPDSIPNGGDDHADSFEPGLGGAATDARLDGESPYQPIEDTPPAEDQPMPNEDQPIPFEHGVPDSPGAPGGTAGTGGENRVQEGTEMER